MPTSSERILVSHAGALPRPDALQRLFGAGPGSQDAIDAALPAAVAEVVGRQAAAGVDIVNDGEISKRGLFTGYIRDRMTGFEAEAGVRFGRVIARSMVDRLMTNTPTRTTAPTRSSDAPLMMAPHAGP